MTSLFFIKLKSSIVCSECDYKRSHFEPAGYLPLCFPEKKNYCNNIIIFYESPHRVPLKIFADVTYSIEKLKSLLFNEYDVTNKIFCCNINNNSLIELQDYVILKDIRGNIFCYEYVEEKAKDYFWIKVNKKYFFWNTYLEFWILGYFDKENINKQSIVDLLRSRLIPFINKTSAGLLSSSIDHLIHVEYEKSSYNEISPFNRTIIKCNISSSNYDFLFGYNFKPIKNMISLVSDKLDLKKCINFFLEKEYIFGDEKQLCENCKNYTIQYKDTKLERLPKYLIIQLKRFRLTGTGTKFEKIDTYVDFDLDEFYINNCKYKVISVINHITPSVSFAFRSIGSNGHYTSYVKFNDEWYFCDDQIVTKVTSISKNDAYILILEKLD